MKSNPLATRYVLPGRLQWLPPDGDSIDAVFERLDKLRFRAAIVGAHGTGKSTLMTHLMPLIETRSRRVVHLQLRGSWNSCCQLWTMARQWTSRGNVLVLDGYEQLPWLARGIIVFWTRIRGVGLLVTSHRPTLLPTLLMTQTDIRVIHQLLDSLLPADTPNRGQLLDNARLQMLLEKHRGNVRELFMQLYDELED